MNESHRNPFGNMNYELTDVSRGFDQKGMSGGKVYGEKGEHAFWPTLEESENEYEPPKIIEEAREYS